MYSSEYTSSFSGPAASHLAAPPSPRHEGNVGQAPTPCNLRNALWVRLGLQKTNLLDNILFHNNLGREL